MTKAPWIVVFLTLNVCLISSISARNSLSEREQKELDIFLQDEGYMEINRIKRTDDGTQDDEDSSGDSQQPELDPVNADENVPNNSTADTIPVLSSENTRDESSVVENTDPIPPETSIVEDTDLEIVEENAENSAMDDTDANTGENTDDSDSSPPSEIQVAQSTDPTLKENENEETPSADSTATTVHTNATESPIIEDRASIGEIAEGNAGDSGIESSPPVVASRSALDQAVTSTNTSTPVDGNQDASLTGNSSISNPPTGSGVDNSTLIEESTPVKDVLPETINSTVNATLPGNSSTNTNATDGDISTSNSTEKLNGTITTEKPGTSVNSTGNVVTKPVVDDPPKKSSVSGSGVLLTVIALVAIAAIAAIGYVVYKRRTGGYDPVNVEEDQDKEMIEVKTENGFGKPIMEHEVKLEDQITPTQPKPSPRTFAATPTTEKKFEDFPERADESKPSLEFDEETKKDDQQ